MDFARYMAILVKYFEAFAKRKIDNYNDEIKQARRDIASEKQMLRMVRAAVKEFSKPPKPFKVPKMTKARKRQLQKMMRNQRVFVAYPGAPVAIGNRPDKK